MASEQNVSDLVLKDFCKHHAGLKTAASDPAAAARLLPTEEQQKDPLVDVCLQFAWEALAEGVFDMLTDRKITNEKTFPPVTELKKKLQVVGEDAIPLYGCPNCRQVQHSTVKEQR